MTPPAGSGAGATRPPLSVLAVLALVPLIVSALTPVPDLVGGPQGDVALYLDRARAVLDGVAPYRELPLEYPPLALVPMVLPAVLWPFGFPSIEVYRWLFAAEMAVLLVALAVVVERIRGIVAGEGGWPADGAAQLELGVRLVVLSVGASLALTWRFDLLPVLLTTVAVWAALDRRPAVAGSAVALGLLVKLFPVAVAPAVALAWLSPPDGRGLARFAGAVVVVTIVGLLPFVALAGVDALAWVGYQAHRGLQVESIGGGLVLLAGLVQGQPIALDAPYRAWEVTGSLADSLLGATTLALAVGFGGLVALGARRVLVDEDRDGGVSASTIVLLATASILLLVVTSKVFSIQYVVWLVPFAALLPRSRFRLAATAIALTIPIHPALYEQLVVQETLPILVLNLRNVLLVALLAWVLVDLARSPRDVAPPSRDGGSGEGGGKEPSRHDGRAERGDEHRPRADLKRA